MRVFKTVMPVVAAWTLGLVCFAAFLETLRPPLPPRVDAPIADVAPPAAGLAPPAAVSAEPFAPSMPVIELDPIVIVAPSARARAAQAAAPATDLAAWSCDEWRPLVQGGIAQRVRSCEPAD